MGADPVKFPHRGCEQIGTGSDRMSLFCKDFAYLRGACPNWFTASPRPAWNLVAESTDDR